MTRPPSTTDVRMKGFASRSTVAEALQWIDQTARPLPSENVGLPGAAGRVLAGDIQSEVDVPGFARAMMDGFALRSVDTLGASTYNPLAPVARQSVTIADAGFSAVNRGSDMVSCISCHRPHGSPYPAMLRCGYRDWPGIDSHTGLQAENGCAVCHTEKD